MDGLDGGGLDGLDGGGLDGGGLDGGGLDGGGLDGGGLDGGGLDGGGFGILTVHVNESAGSLPTLSTAFTINVCVPCPKLMKSIGETHGLMSELPSVLQTK